MAEYRSAKLRQGYDHTYSQPSIVINIPSASADVSEEITSLSWKQGSPSRPPAEDEFPRFAAADQWSSSYCTKTRVRGAGRWEEVRAAEMVFSAAVRRRVANGLRVSGIVAREVWMSIMKGLRGL